MRAGRAYCKESHNDDLAIKHLEGIVRVYLDCCCYNRPFDLPSNNTIMFESAAKLLVQQWIAEGQIEVADSFVLREELSGITDEQKLDIISKFIDDNATTYVASDKASDILMLAKTIMRDGIKYMDAAHIACAIVSKSEYFLTTDKRVLKFKSDAIKVTNPIDYVRIQEEQHDS